MKTITKSNLSLYLLELDEPVDIQSDKIIVGSPERFIISDLNNGNAVLHVGVTPPDDWAGGKYNYDGTNWTLA